MRALALALLSVPGAAAPLDLPKGKFAVELVETVSRPESTELLLRFPSPVKSPWPANDTVWAHLVIPASAKGKKVPAVLVLPVMAAPNVWIETRFVRRFVEDGLAVMWLEMPTQFNRRPHPSMPSGQVFLARTPKRLAANFRQSVLDARRALGVLAARPEVDAGRIGVFGISLGSLVGSALYSVDERPAAGFFLLGGADFPTLLRDSSMTGPFVRRMGLDPESLRRSFAGIDPLERRQANAGKRVLLLNARWDRVIPRENALKLREAFPDSRQIWVPLGHYSAALHLFWLPRWVSKQVERTLLEPGKNTIKTASRP